MPRPSLSLRKSSGFNSWSMGVLMVKNPLCFRLRDQFGQRQCCRGMMGLQSHVYTCMHRVRDVIAEKPPGPSSDERNTCVSETDYFLPDPVLSRCCLWRNTSNQHCMHCIQCITIPAAWNSRFTRNTRKHPETSCVMEMDSVL